MIFSLTDGRTSAWQWDRNLSLNVDDSEYQIEEIHMSNEATKGAFVCEMKDDRTVAIPNILLTASRDIFIYVVVSDNYGKRTELRETLHVHARKKPQDYVYTETEVYEYRDYITRLEAVENTVLQAGTVYTLPPDEGAYVNIRVSTNEDNSKTYYIDFYIPEGQQGEPGKPGSPGNPGANGKTPYIQNGYWYIDGVNLGVKAEGTPGAPGTSVTITRIIESTESGGTNIVEFSDGNRLNVRNGEDGEGGGGGVIEETDPTVPSWAKQTNKPTYSKSEVGLGNVDNVKQYSASNPPPYPVTSVNGKTGAVTVSVPTQTSQLTNDSGFITKAVSDLANYYLKSETLSKTEINALVSAIPKFAIQVVSSLPTSDISTTTVYLLKSGTDSDLYTEYIYVNGVWEILGSQRVDLTGYALKEDIPTKLSELDNDSGYITKAVSDLVNYYKKSEVYSKDEIDKKGFLTEHQDISGKLDANKLPEAINEALAQAKESGEFDGEDGKTAYEYAQDGGFQGTETEFAEKLAFLMGYSVYGYVDADNNIIVSGSLADGTYAVKYEMQNGSTLDIGELKFHYSVTNTLTNCVSSNNSTSAANGGVYSATISANDGYELRSIVVTMDDEDISSTAVSGNTISIESVKGDIVITATATEVIVATNFFKATPTVNTIATASQDALVIGGRYGSDMGYRADAGPETLLSNYIPVQNGDEVYITNLELAALFSGLCANIGDTKPIGVFSSSNENGQVTELDTSGDIDKFKIANASANYVRICGKPSNSIKVNASGSTVVEKYDCSKIIVNIKRNGEWL